MNDLPQFRHASKTLLLLGASLLLASTGCANDAEFSGEEETVDESQAELSTEVGEDVDPEKDVDAKATKAANDAAPQVHELLASSRLRHLGTKCLWYRNRQLIICGSTYISTPPECQKDFYSYEDDNHGVVDVSAWSSSTEVKVVFSATSTKPGILVSSGNVFEDRYSFAESTDQSDRDDTSRTMNVTRRAGGHVSAAGNTEVSHVESAAQSGFWEETAGGWTKQFRTRFAFNPRGPEAAKTYLARAPGIEFARNSFCALAAR